MNTLSYKTISANQSTVEKNWLIIDAENAVLGRLASSAANLLRGKHKTSFTPHVDCGDNVIVINAEKIKLTGNKWRDRRLFSYTGYPGGQKQESPLEIHSKKPTALVELAIKRMLPKNKLGNKIFKNLFVFAGPEHTHAAQQPAIFKLK